MENNLEKNFIELFEKLCQSRSSWSVWEDLITAIAICLSNPVTCQYDLALYEKREKEFLACIDRLGERESIIKLFSIIIQAIEQNSKQDFLGKIFTKLGLPSHYKGQFFTPYNICELMSKLSLNIENIKETVLKRGWISINDCACGAGATLIAATNVLREQGISYQKSALFIAQDIDRITGLMCYIQLTLLGCSGYVVIADTLSNPLVGTDICPKEQSGQEFWYMPMFFSSTWTSRRIFNNRESA